LNKSDLFILGEQDDWMTEYDAVVEENRIKYRVLIQPGKFRLFYIIEDTCFCLPNP